MDPRAERRRRLAQLEVLLDFYTFVCRAWPIVVPTPMQVDPRGLAYDVIHTLCIHLQAAIEGRIPWLIVNVPPGSAKSLLTSVFLPAWIWLRKPWLRLLFASYSDDLVTRDSDYTRQLITSDWYQDLICRAWAIRRDRSTVWLFANNRHGFRQCMTVGGGSTGHRGDALVIDDPIHALNALNPLLLAKVIEWYGLAMSSRFNDMTKAVIILIMQRLHDDDLSGHLIRRGGFTLLKLQSICEQRCKTPIWEDPRKPGELLSPHRSPMAVLDGAKIDLGGGFAGQHQQEPVDVLASLFPRTAWRFWRFEGDPDRSGNRPRGCDTGPAMVLPRLDREIITVDCGFKGQTHHDRVAMHRWGAAGALRFLLNRQTRPLSYSDTKRDFGLFVRQHPRYEFALVEEKANGSALVDEMRSVVPRLNPDNYRDLVHPQDNKVTRAVAWSPQQRAGQIYLYEGTDAAELEQFVAEHERFPKAGAGHDDDVDAASLAMNALRDADLEASAALCEVDRLAGTMAALRGRFG